MQESKFSAMDKIFDTKLIHDATALASGVAGAAVAMSQQAVKQLSVCVDDVASRMNLVSRDEFEVLKAMLIALRQQQDEINQRLNGLEQHIDIKKSDVTIK